MNKTRLLSILFLCSSMGAVAGCLSEDGPVAACEASSDCPGSLPVCDEELGACTPCGLDLDCRLHPQSPYCDADSGQCVECSEDEQCDTRLCVDNACVLGCRDEVQCSPEAPVCEAGICVEGCRDDRHCTGETSVCDVAEDRCVQCLRDEDCEDGARPLCKDERCVAGCTRNEHCSGETPFCDLEQEICVQCQLDSQCQVPTPLCRAQICVEGCNSHEQCSGDTPLCDLRNETCVQCLHHRQCGGDTPVCKDNVCIPGCIDDADCSSAEAARCNEDFQCVPCNDSVQCVGVPGRDLCEAGSCVECTVDDETACGSRSCDPRSSECTQTERGSIGVCGPCIADSECGDSQGKASDQHRCIALTYMGEPQGGRCLRARAETVPECPRPYLPTITAPSLSGELSADYCGINEELTTCEAVLAGAGGTTCASGMPTECALEGALCESISGVSFCTYPCLSGAECSSNFPSCGQGGFCRRAPNP